VTPTKTGLLLICCEELLVVVCSRYDAFQNTTHNRVTQKCKKKKLKKYNNKNAQKYNSKNTTHYRVTQKGPWRYQKSSVVLEETIWRLIDFAGTNTSKISW